jgi:sugar phosphate isomerase/epimerase
MPPALSLDCLVASPCSNPHLELDDVLRHYAAIGFSKFEAFTGWVRSAIDLDGPARELRENVASCGMQVTSMHLPPVTDDGERTLARAVQAAAFAAELGADVVLFKASSIQHYVRWAPHFLEATADLPLTPVLQNHVGSAVSTLEDVRTVRAGVADERLKSLLEVGQFHALGTTWREAVDVLGDSLALVHIKDQVGAERVPFGQGEVDFEGLIGWLNSVGYTGSIVVEMEVCPEDDARTFALLAEAREHLARWLA